MQNNKEILMFDDIYPKYTDNILDYILLAALLLIILIIFDGLLLLLGAVPSFLSQMFGSAVNTTLLSYLINILLHIISPLLLVILITSSKHVDKKGNDLLLDFSEGWDDLISSKFIYTIITAIIIALYPNFKTQISGRV